MILQPRPDGVRPQSILVFGAGGHSKEVASAIRALGHTPVIRGMGEHDPEWAKVGKLEDVAGLVCDGWIVAIGNNADRASIYDKLRQFMSVSPVSVVHPTAWIEPSAFVGDGVYVAAGATVQISYVGAGSIINSGAVVSHDCYVDCFVHVAPLAALCGACIIKMGAFIGAGSVVKPGVRVGRWAVIGCGAAVVSDVWEDTLSVGVPAKAVHLGDNRNDTLPNQAEAKREVRSAERPADAVAQPGRGQKCKGNRKAP